MNLSLTFHRMVPGLVGVVLVLATALPISVSSFPLTPHAAWLMTVVMATLYPACWPAWFAFFLGLLQDVMFATPLGSNALLAVLLLMAIRARPRRLTNPALRILWLEATLGLIAWHALLWVVLAWIMPHPPQLLPLLIAGAVTAMWFPLFYGIGFLLTKR